MKRIRIRNILSSERTGDRFTVMGWVRTKRDSKGGFSFIEINDGSCLGNLQVVANANLPNYKEEILKLQTGCSVRVSGVLKASQGKGQKIAVEVETGKSNIKGNLAKIKKAGFDQIILVATSPAAVTACQKAVDLTERNQSPQVEQLTWFDLS